MSRSSRVQVVLAAFLLILGACRPTPPPTAVSTVPLPNSISATPLALLARPTLPPSWTPTPTHTATFTPTITPTWTITPTLGAEEICDGVEPAQIGNYGEVLLIVVETNSDDVGQNLRLANRDNGERFDIQLPGGQQTIASLPINDLPGAGVYEWILSAFTETQTGLCEQTGTFEVFAPPPLAQLIEVLAEGGIGVTPIPTPTPEATSEITPEADSETTPEATAEATLEATSETAPDAAIEATATR